MPIPESDDHAQHDDALERMLPRYIAPALDFFDAFLIGRSDPADVPRVRWHLAPWAGGNRPAGPLPGAVRAAASISTAPRRAARRDGGSARRARRARRGDLDPRPADLVPSTLVNPFAALLEYPDEREVESRPDVLTFTTPAFRTSR